MDMRLFEQSMTDNFFFSIELIISYLTFLILKKKIRETLKMSFYFSASKTV